jgi:hypothetical protein
MQATQHIQLVRSWWPVLIRSGRKETIDWFSLMLICFERKLPGLIHTNKSSLLFIYRAGHSVGGWETTHTRTTPATPPAMRTKSAFPLYMAVAGPHHHRPRRNSHRDMMHAQFDSWGDYASCLQFTTKARERGVDNHAQWQGCSFQEGDAVHHAVLSSHPTPVEQLQILFGTALNQKKIR